MTFGIYTLTGSIVAIDYSGSVLVLLDAVCSTGFSSGFVSGSYSSAGMSTTTSTSSGMMLLSDGLTAIWITAGFFSFIFLTHSADTYRTESFSILMQSFRLGPMNSSL